MIQLFFLTVPNGFITFALFPVEISSTFFRFLLFKKAWVRETSRKYDAIFAYDTKQINVFYVIVYPLFLGDNPTSFSFFL